MDKDNSSAVVAPTTGAVAGTVFLYTCGWMLDQTSLGASGSGSGDTTGAYNEDPDLAHALSFGFGAGSSSYTPNPEIIITLADNKPQTQVEEKAKQVYDKYNKNHTKEKDEGASMIIVDSDAKDLFDSIIGGSSTRLELIRSLTALEETIINSSQKQTSSGRVKIISKK